MAPPAKPIIAYLTAGGAGMYCGSCMRDNTLAAALARLECDPWLIPLYTPIRTDETDVSIDRVFFGGINVFLQQKSAIFRWLPEFLDGWLDAPWLLKRVATGNITVNAKELGDLTISMLRGEHGRQRKEVRRLVRWLKRDVRPNIVTLSNMLIAGCVPSIKRELKIPVVATLQGDDIFLDDLPDSHRKTAMEEIRRLANSIDGFIAFSEYYADYMSEYLAVPRARFQIAPMGIAPRARTIPVANNEKPRIGYFARVCPAKGFHVLVDAWLEMRRRPKAPPAELWAAGWLGVSDREYFAEQMNRVRAAGLESDFHFQGTLDRDEKFKFLESLDVFSVPTVYREPKGIYVLESLACGVPVVQPAHGAFPELVPATGGGVLVTPNDPSALADALQNLLEDKERRRRLGETGRAAVLERFTDEAMARRTLEIFRAFLDKQTSEVNRQPQAATAGS